jgi:hypothetical protein
LAVTSLPMAPLSCSLNEAALRSQLERYRITGRDATIVERSPRRLVIGIGDHVPDDVVAELVQVERECCPFFGLDWQPGRRRLAVSVASEWHEPALEAIAVALGVEKV